MDHVEHKYQHVHIVHNPKEYGFSSPKFLPNAQNKKDQWNERSKNKNMPEKLTRLVIQTVRISWQSFVLILIIYERLQSLAHQIPNLEEQLF